MTEPGPTAAFEFDPALATARDLLFPKQQGPLTPFQLARMKRHAMANRPMQMRYVWLLQRGEHKITAAARAAGEEVSKVDKDIRRKVRNKLKAARRAAR